MSQTQQDWKDEKEVIWDGTVTGSDSKMPEELVTACCDWETF